MAGRRKMEPAVIDGEATEVTGGALVDPAREREINERQQLVVAEFGDGLPWHPAHYEAEIKRELQSGLVSLLRAGRYMLVARECAAHGEWAGMLERLGVSRSQAQRMMEAARRTSNVPSLGHLGEKLGSTKFFDLLALPDDELAELAEGGSIDGIGDAEDLAGMTSRELKAALREARETIAAKDERSAERERKIEKLQRDLSKAKRERAEATPDEVAVQLRDACSKAVMAVRAELSGVDETFAELAAHGVETESSNSAFLAGLVHELLTDVQLIRDGLGLPILGVE